MHGKDKKKNSWSVTRKETEHLEGCGTDMVILLQWILCMCVFQGMAVILVPVHDT